jgi:hypothetical protein
MDVNRSRRYLDLTDSKENEPAGRVGCVSVNNPSKLLIICDLAERVGFEGSFGQILCVQRDAANRNPYRQLGSITSGTIVTEKTLIDHDRPDCSMDGMDSISPLRHKPPPVSTPAPGSRDAARRVLGFHDGGCACRNLPQIRHDPLAVSRSQAQRILFRQLIPEPTHVTAVKGR